MKYEFQCIKNCIEWNCKDCNNFKQMTAITLMFPTMFDQINKILKLITCHAQTQKNDDNNNMY